MIAAVAAIVLVGASLGLRALAVRAAEWPFFAVRGVDVVGTQRISETEIVAIAGVEVGESWLALDPHAVKLRVGALPWVARVRVSRPWLGRVRVAVRESVPVALIELAGSVRPVTSDVRVLPADPDDVGPLPTIRGVQRGKGFDEDALARAIAYIRELREQGFARPEAIEIVVTETADRIGLRDLGFLASIESPMEPRAAIENVLSFLETLDGEGGAHGTLRVISRDTAVWDAG